MSNFTIENISLHNSTSSSSSGTHKSTQSDSFENIFWYAAFSSMLSIAIFGNILVIWIIIANRRMRTVTNYFILNLSFSDFTMALLNSVPNFIYMVEKDWIFGSLLCKINNFVATLTVSSCVFTMTAISIDRYMAIILPFRPRISKKAAWRGIYFIWISSSILSLPSLLYSEIITFSLNNNSNNFKKTKTICFLKWPDDKSPTESHIDFAYNVIILFLTYILPMVSMGISYGKMSKELWGVSSISESSNRQYESMASKRKVVRMFIVIVVTFGVCWLPYHAYFLYQYYDGSIAYKKWAQTLFLFFYWLAMSTSMINPIIYYFMNSKLRSHFENIVRRALCLKKPDFEPSSQPQPNFQLRQTTPCSHSSGRRQNERRVVREEKREKPTRVLYRNHPNYKREKFQRSSELLDLRIDPIFKKNSTTYC